MRKKGTGKRAIPKWLTEADRVAMQTALDWVLKYDAPDCQEQIKHKLKEDGWYDAASFAAYHLQCARLRRQLGMRPWDSPPCHLIDDPGNVVGNGTCAELAFRMDALGISLWHPDPIQAVADAEKRIGKQTGWELLINAAAQPDDVA